MPPSAGLERNHRFTVCSTSRPGRRWPGVCGRASRYCLRAPPAVKEPAAALHRRIRSPSARRGPTSITTTIAARSRGSPRPAGARCGIGVLPHPAPRSRPRHENMMANVKILREGPIPPYQHPANPGMMPSEPTATPREGDVTPCDLGTQARRATRAIQLDRPRRGPPRMS